MSTSWELFAVAAPGLEAVVANELRALGIEPRKTVTGGVVFSGDLATVARANLHLRAASRVLIRLGAFDAPGRRELVARAKKVALERFVRGGPLEVEATCKQSRLYHTGLVAEALHEAFGTVAAQPGETAPLVVVRIVRDRCELSLDTSGELLHRRGARQETSRAPMRETLAAGLLLLAGYDGETAFADPMCGAGTILLEAASIAARQAPGIARSFAFESFVGAEPAILARLKAEAKGRERTPPHVIAGSDINAGALGVARRNLERAGLLSHVRVERMDVARLAPPAPTGLLLTNPPYGRRIEDADQAIDSLGFALRTAFRGWNRGVFAPKAIARAALGREPDASHRLVNGGIEVELALLKPESIA